MNFEIKKRIEAIDNTDVIRLFFSLLKQLLATAQISESDERLSLTVRNDNRKRLSVNINSRLAMFIEDKNIGIMLNKNDVDDLSYIPIKNKETFSKTPIVNLVHYNFDDFQNNVDVLEPLWLKSCLEYLPTQTKSQYRDHHIPELYQMAIDENILEVYLASINIVNVKQSFIQWMIDTDGNVRNYFSKQFGSDEDRFTKEIDEYESVYHEHFNAELFQITPKDLDAKLKELRTNLYSKVGGFREYNQRKATGRPTAILGTQNYFVFLKDYFQTKQTMENSSLREKLLPYIERYKKLIIESEVYSEMYKWESLQNFKNNWDLSSDDLPQMIERALPGSNNLWSSNNYYPVAMLKAFADTNPKGVSDALHALFNEQNPLASRIEDYRSAMDNLLEEDSRKRNETNKSNYQDGRTIALLLAFQYPDVHFLYKFNILKSFCNKFGYDAPKKGDVINQILMNVEINKEVKAILEKDDELLRLHKERLTPDSYRNDDNNLLTQDFIYATVTYLNDDAKHYLVGAFWDTETPQDQTSRFIEEGIWFNGYTDKFINDVIKVKPGSRIAIKSAFVREKTRSVMAIKARGVVTENLNDGQTLMVNWEKNFVPFEVSFGGYLTTIKEVSNEAHIKSIWHEKPLENISQDDLKDVPLNQILYGPPGTGKTYNTILEAARIVSKKPNLKYDEAKSIFNENLGGQIEFITFHQNYSYEDFIQGLRPDTENGYGLSFEKKDGVFKRIANRALKNSQAAKNPANVKKDFEVVFQQLIKPLNDGEVEELEIKMKKTSFYITEVGAKSIEFRKNTGDSKHTLSISTLSKMYDSGVNSLIFGGLQPYYNPILETLLEKGKQSLEKVERKNYVIIIDEINRANISRVFGELITLIEEDKRSDGKIPMRVTLPSGDTFMVPSNLYIIGTMNTADKSIALLDIALRRRFDFVPMYPKYEIENQTIYHSEILRLLNERICAKKNRDFQIGHSYFMDNEKLEEIMNRKIIPLLLEYFMNNEKEVRELLVFEGYSVDKESWPMKFSKN